MFRSLPKTSKWLAGLHPAAVSVYFVTLFVMAMTYTHPVYLGAILLMTVWGIAQAGAWDVWKRYVPFAFIMTIVIVLINGLVSRNGQTVLFQGPRLPLFGQFFVTQEALCFGLNMGLKLFVILSVCCFYETLMPADKSFSFFSQIVPKSALILILAAFLVPQMKRHVHQIGIVMKCRGAKFDDAGIQRISSRLPLMKVLFLSSLEDSWQKAEALHARAFGLGKRTFFQRDGWHLGNTLIVLSSCVVALVFAVSIQQHKGFMKFYPMLDMHWDSVDAGIVGIIFLGGIVVPALDAGWRIANCLKSTT